MRIEKNTRDLRVGTIFYSGPISAHEFEIISIEKYGYKWRLKGSSTINWFDHEYVFVEGCQKCNGQGELTAFSGNAYTYQCPRCQGSGEEPDIEPKSDEACTIWDWQNGKPKKIRITHKN